MLAPLGSSFAFLLVSQPLVARLTDQLFDNTFEGIYRLTFFDWALLVPYFSILIILSVYGLHRFETMRVYLKHRKKLPREPQVRFATLPKVTVQLPLFNERFIIVARLLEEVIQTSTTRAICCKSRFSTTPLTKPTHTPSGS